MNTVASRSFAVGSILVAAVGLAACSSSDDSSSSSMPSSSAPAMTTGSAMNAGLVGPGCAAYASQVPTGAGSVQGMAEDPVATAAGNNPLLTQLTAAVSGKLNSKVDLVNTLNGGEFTVFAPVDDAFKKLPASTVKSLKTDDATLKKILTYHVVPGQLSPSEVDGKQTTAEGATVDVTGSGNNLKVNGANVICGGVKTANATVYLIDQVLMPKM